MAGVGRLEVRVDERIRVVTVDEDLRERPLTDVLRRSGWLLNTRCGERGLCKGCLVELLDGHLRCLTDKRSVVAADQNPLMLRACDHCLTDEGQARIRIPPRSLLAHRPQVVTSFRLNVPWTHAPLYSSTGELSCGRDGHPRAMRLGAAIDIGTTTVVVAIVDLSNGNVVGQASALNAQTFLGDNVLTRIELCMSDPGMTRRLQQALIDETLRPLLRDALIEGSAEPGQLEVLVVAGNTTMLHLLAGVDPSAMGVAPFWPVFCEYRQLAAAEIGLLPSEVRSDVIVHLLPSAGAYVGADIVAGVLSTGLAYESEPCLLLDLGTNGEIVLKHEDRLWGCATAAGPAFEGTGLTCGVRACAGAISHLWFEGQPPAPRYDVIGGGRPIGLCGTAYLDFVARGRRSGLIGPTGRFCTERTASASRRMARLGRAVTVTREAGGDPIVVTEHDVAVLLQAKAAVAAGITCLLKRAKIIARDLKTVFVAGGFGFHMHIDSLIECGILPGIAPEQVSLVGNASLAGAYASLVDQTFLEELRQWAERIELVELNLDPEFETVYVDQLSLP